MDSKNELFSLRRDVFSEEGRFFPLVYRLLEEDGAPTVKRYAICCCVEGVDLDERPYDLAEADLPCGSAEDALSVIEKLARADVMPIHISELLEEFLA